MKHNDMTTSETQLVQRMFEMIVPLADTFALIFYERLFFLAPQVRPLFQTEMSLQREKLMTMLALIVRGLDQPEALVHELKKLGLRHASYRVEPDHYLIVNEAVIWTVKECLGDKVTDEMYIAWKKMLSLVSNTMLEGAAGSR